MKGTLIASVVASIVAIGLGIWGFVQRGEIQSLAQQLEASREETKSTQAALTTKIGELATANTAIKQLEASGADKDAKLAAAESQLSRASASETALTGLLERTNAASKAMSDDAEVAANSVHQAEDDLFANPNEKTFNALKTAHDVFASSLKTCSEKLDECNKFVEQNQGALASAKTQVDEQQAKNAETRKQLEDAKVLAEKSRKSCRSSSFAVLATEQWQSSDLSVEDGEVIAVSTNGKWRWAQSLENPVTDAQGTNGSEQYRVLAQFPNAALLARIRGSTERFLGAKSFKPDRMGKVEFRINDDQISDNSGSIDVKMWAFLPLPGR